MKLATFTYFLSSISLFSSSVTGEKICRDDTSFRFKVDKTCSWVKETDDRIYKFCRWPAVNRACENTCGKCCYDDENFRFTIPDGRKKRCAWVSKEREQYCSYNEGGILVKNACPDACGICQNGYRVPASVPTVSAVTRSPTQSPTHFPTNSPTKVPTKAPTEATTAAAPTKSPTPNPTLPPTNPLSPAPTKSPTASPIDASNPTNTIITVSPTTQQTRSPTAAPTAKQNPSPTTMECNVGVSLSFPSISPQYDLDKYSVIQGANGKSYDIVINNDYNFVIFARAIPEAEENIVGLLTFTINGMPGNADFIGNFYLGNDQSSDSILEVTMTCSDDCMCSFRNDKMDPIPTQTPTIKTNTITTAPSAPTKEIIASPTPEPTRRRITASPTRTSTENPTPRTASPTRTITENPTLRITASPTTSPTEKITSSPTKAPVIPIPESCEVVATLSFPEDEYAGDDYYYFHNDELIVKRTDRDDSCELSNSTDYCEHFQDGAFGDAYYSEEYVTIFDAAGYTFDVAVWHKFDYYEQYTNSTTDYDHEQVGKLTFSVNGKEVEGEWYHDFDPDVHTHDEYGYENSDYDSLLVVSMECSEDCQCSFKKTE